MGKDRRPARTPLLRGGAERGTAPASEATNTNATESTAVPDEVPMVVWIIPFLSLR